MALIGLALAAVAGGGFAAGRWSRPTTVAATPQPPSVTIASAQAGDVVVVDGREVGVTPYRLVVDSSVHEVRLAPAPSAAADASAPQPVATAMPPVPMDTLVPARPRSGGVRLSSPIEIQVLEGERVLGSSAEGPIVAAAGVHQLDFVNSALGYRERRAVEFRAGQVISIAITPPNGMLNINALPWAQVTIDGKDVGETPLANVSITTGTHEIVFRHPQFGERRETAVVKSGGVTRMSVTMSRPTP